jgi:hypothetical protein
MDTPARLPALLNDLPGVKDAVLCTDKGRPLEATGTARADDVAASTAVTIQALKTIGQQLALGPLQKAVAKGPSAAQVIAVQPGVIVSVKMDPKRPIAELEGRLADPRWAAPRGPVVDKPAEKAPAGRPAAETVVVAPLRTTIEPAPSVPARPEGRTARVAAGRETGFSGQLSLFALPELLEFLRGGQRTGRLHLGSRSGAGTVRLRRGKLCAASSPRASGIGGYLVEAGVLSREQLRQALEAQQQDAQRRHLGLLLIDGQLASAGEIRTALVAQVHDAVRELKEWVDGQFTFEPESAAEPALADIEVELDPQAILLAIFKEEDERAENGH